MYVSFQMMRGGSYDDCFKVNYQCDVKFIKILLMYVIICIMNEGLLCELGLVQKFL